MLTAVCMDMIMALQWTQNIVFIYAQLPTSTKNWAGAQWLTQILVPYVGPNKNEHMYYEVHLKGTVVALQCIQRLYDKLTSTRNKTTFFIQPTLQSIASPTLSTWHEKRPIMHLAQVTVFHYPHLVPPSAFHCNYETLQALLWLQNTRQGGGETRDGEGKRAESISISALCDVIWKSAGRFGSLAFFSLSALPWQEEESCCQKRSTLRT